jgi:hypothetical protein
MLSDRYELYMKFGRPPTTTDYDQRSTLTSSDSYVGDVLYRLHERRKFASRRVVRHHATKVGISPSQGCQIVYFQTKNTKVGKFGRAFEW